MLYIKRNYKAFIYTSSPNFVFAALEGLVEAMMLSFLGVVKLMRGKVVERQDTSVVGPKMSATWTLQI